MNKRGSVYNIVFKNSRFDPNIRNAEHMFPVTNVSMQKLLRLTLLFLVSTKY